jgi:hypothetical protein
MTQRRNVRVVSQTTVLDTKGSRTIQRVATLLAMKTAMATAVAMPLAVSAFAIATRMVATLPRIVRRAYLVSGLTP